MDSDEKKLRYDLHCHTIYSKCSFQSIKDTLRFAKIRGLDGIAITDHNEIRGALEAKKLAKKLFSNKTFEVVIGEEILTDKGEILAYYLNERIRPGRFEDVIDEIRRQGALCSIAHPFTRFRKNFSGDLKRAAKVVDAIETFNARNIVPGANRNAEVAAQKYKIARTGGSDAHFPFEVGSGYTTFSESLSLEKAIRLKKTLAGGSWLMAPFGFIASGLSKKLR
ncbi:MAG: PHP domain-containing protein [Candidatus Woesearchaeota archaeon]